MVILEAEEAEVRARTFERTEHEGEAVRPLAPLFVVADGTLAHRPLIDILEERWDRGRAVGDRGEVALVAAVDEAVGTREVERRRRNSGSAAIARRRFSNRYGLMVRGFSSQGRRSPTGTSRGDVSCDAGVTSTEP